jgi:sulfite reductase (NADPH) flavoprotein alpha-component
VKLLHGLPVVSARIFPSGAIKNDRRSQVSFHERDATRSKGRDWLFLGDQRRSHDFLYEDELSDFVARGVLTQLDTVFSQDDYSMVYVQDLIVERNAVLFDWLQNGAHVYVCGDAKRMAADIGRSLREAIRREVNITEESARTDIVRLSISGRYLPDVH